MAEELSKLVEDSEVDNPLAEVVAKLETEIEAVKDARLEERFIWIVVVISLFDSMIFGSMESWSAPVIIGLIELVLLVVLARRYGIQEVDQMLAKFLDRAADLTHKSKVN